MITFCLLMIAIITALSTTLFYSSPVQATFTVREPIYINGNDNFNSANGVTSGNGTKNDPYIIENWHIMAGSANGIDIRNTTVYFIVRNCLVENGGTSYDGINLNNVSNGTVDGNTCDNSNNGIHLVNSYRENVTSNTCRNDDDGIFLINSNYNYLAKNIIENNPHNGIGLTAANYNAVEYNIYGNNLYCIHTVASNNNIISNNTCSNSSLGISIENNSENNTISNNICHGCDEGIVTYASASYNTIENNTCENAFYSGIYLYSSSDYNIVKNNICSNNYGDYARGIYLNATCDNNLIENNTCDNNHYGINLIYSSNFNTIINNICKSNYYGIYLNTSNNNTITHNSLLNSAIYNGYDNRTSTNYWDSGYPAGGNYWRDYIGVDYSHGPNQNILGSDGIGDMPYSLGFANMDHYPLMRPWPLIRTVSVSFSGRSESGNISDGLSYAATVTNTGNVSDSYSLTVSDNSGWSTSVYPASLILSAGSSGTVILTVIIPSNAARGANDLITVIATSQVDNEVSAHGTSTAIATAGKGISVLVYLGAIIAVVVVIATILIIKAVQFSDSS